MSRLVIFLTVFAAGLVAPAAALAHGGDEAFVHVPLDHIMPGEAFPVIAADLGSGATVSLRMLQGERQAELGVVVAEPDGHFQTTARLPSDFPHGYAQLIASSDDGSEVSTWVLVGPRDQAPAGGPPTSASASDWWADPSVLVLAGILGVAGLALLAVTLRSTRRERATATALRARPVARKGGSKARRRR